MSDETTTTQEQEVKDAPEETVNDEQATEETIGDTLEDTQTEESPQEKKVPDNVPKARLDKEIQRRKDAEAELEALKKDKADEGSTTSETDSDPEVKKLADKLAKIEEKERQVRQDAILSEGIDKALAEAPEYKKVANTDLLKQMAMLPQNKDKTFNQLLDEAYGNAISGKRTIESTTPRGGAADVKVDMERAQRDAEYRKEILRDPEMKKQYNVGLENRINL